MCFSSWHSPQAERGRGGVPGAGTGRSLVAERQLVFRGTAEAKDKGPAASYLHKQHGSVGRVCSLPAGDVGWQRPY